jgi:hypothetical protein
VLAAGDGRHERLVRDVEERRQRSRDHRDGVELRDRQDAGRRRGGDRGERGRASDVRRDEERSARPAVDERPERQREDEHRREGRRGDDETWNAVAWSVATAVSGSARAVTWLPTLLIAWAAQSARSRCGRA